eukprot:TRINITY_DN30690_c0_g1_i1.p1 TRINITY_DN30690_c0_g1~~TRINITY_DN30690_c0_g1_i1.p1  ORF type:complete len:187 (+),score=58.80 TRINITY_DN30690_c0_g1_i1:297-857(+)
MPRAASYAARFGGDEERARQADDSWRRVLTAEGLPYLSGGRGETGPTGDAHRLALWVRERYGSDQEARLHDSLFRAHFAEGRSPCDRAALVAAAAAAGASAEDAEVFLASGELAEKLQYELAGAHELVSPFNSGVPFFLFEDAATGVRQIVPGAQEREVFAAVIARLIRKAATVEQERRAEHSSKL